jgi:hypothetical protein
MALHARRQKTSNSKVVRISLVDLLRITTQFYQNEDARDIHINTDNTPCILMAVVIKETFSLRHVHV